MSQPNNKMWELYPHIWKTESAYLSFIRGGIRRYLWSKNPVKLEFEKEAQVKIKNTNPRSMKAYPLVLGYVCAMCGGSFKSNEVQCDHKTGEHALRTVNDVQSFVEGIVMVRKEDLQMLCKPCHEVKTYSDREGITIEEARPVKLAIAKEKEGTKQVVDFIKKKGMIVGGNAKKRRVQLIEIYKGEQE